MRNFVNKVLHSKSHGGVLARGALGVFVVKVAGAGLLFALHVMLARLLGVEHYGIYVYAIACINILVILCLMGFQTSLLRFISAYRVRREPGLLKGLLRYSNSLVFISSITVAAIGLIFVSFLGDQISQEQRHTFYFAFSLLPIFAFAKLRETHLRAIKNVIQSQLLLRVIRPLTMAVVSVGFWYLLRHQIKASLAMIANLIALVVTFCIGSRWLHKVLQNTIQDCQAIYRKKEWLRVSLPLLFIVGMNLLLKRTDIIMLGAIRSSEETGFYSAATHISNLLLFGLMAVNSILAPLISELYHTDRFQELQRIIKLAAVGIFVFTVLVGTLLLVSGRYLLSLFGEAFVIAYLPLVILLSGRIVSSLAGPVGFLMTMTGYQNQAGVIVASAAAVNISLNALLIPVMGPLGAAIATAFSMALFNIVMLIYVLRNLRINPTIINRTYGK